MKQLDVDEDVADHPRAGGLLEHRGDRLRAAERAGRHRGIRREIVQELRNRARDVLLTQAIASEETIESARAGRGPARCSRAWTTSLAGELARHGIVTREDLAEQAVDDLGEIDDLDPERAGELIMAARKHWFEQESAGAEPESTPWRK